VKPDTWRNMYSSLLDPRVDAVVHNVSSDISLYPHYLFHTRTQLLQRFLPVTINCKQLCDGVRGTATALSRCVRTLSENAGELGHIPVEMRARWYCAELVALVQGFSPRAPRQSRSWRICSTSCGRLKQRR
jgi:hypothetical protein